MPPRPSLSMHASLKGRCAMRRTLIFGAATAAVALALAGCRSHSPVEAVYGPPPEIDPLDQDQNEDATSSDDANSLQQREEEIDEPIEDVYGSPVEFETQRDDGEEDPPIALLYGPAPMNL